MLVPAAPLCQPMGVTTCAPSVLSLAALLASEPITVDESSFSEAAM